MNRIQAWALHISTIVLTVTGLIYAYMHYLMKPADPFSVVNHPAEPYLIDIHILAAPVLVIMIGIILHSHILFKIQSGARVARKSGLILIPMFAAMVFSGYALQVVNGDIRKIMVVVHLATGSFWFLFYAVHHIASLKVRSLQRQNGRVATNGSQHPILSARADSPRTHQKHHPNAPLH